MSEKSELMLALEQIEKDKGIKKEEILHVIENALVSAYKKHVGKNVNVEATVDSVTGEMAANVVKKVVPEVKNSAMEISLAEAKKINPQIKMDEDVHIPLDTQDFSRIAAQTAKQVIVQKIRESERETLLGELQAKVGQMVNGVVWRFANRNLIVDMGKTEAILPSSEQIFKERFNLGQHVRAVIVKVERSPRGPAVILSRSHPDLVRRLFEVEVPEIYEKVVEIVNVVREPGMRTKVAVVSHNPKVDPVGACVGVKGARVKPIIEELQGERIDLIPYSPDISRYIAAALSPAKVLGVSILSLEDKKAEVLVGDDMLSLAIGKNGHNVRLAAKLTGWHIDVKSESQRRQESREKAAATTETFLQLEGIGPKIAEVLAKAGLSIERIAQSQPDELMTLQGVGEKTAEKLIDAAKKFLAAKGRKGEEETGEEEEAATGETPAEDKESGDETEGEPEEEGEEEKEEENGEEKEQE